MRRKVAVKTSRTARNADLCPLEMRRRARRRRLVQDLPSARHPVSWLGAQEARLDEGAHCLTRSNLAVRDCRCGRTRKRSRSTRRASRPSSRAQVSSVASRGPSTPPWRPRRRPRHTRRPRRPRRSGTRPGRILCLPSGEPGLSHIRPTLMRQPTTHHDTPTRMPSCPRCPDSVRRTPSPAAAILI